ncbi:MAG: hypothetical protein ABSD74_14895 [Rhizomicrobium sp.]
MRQRDRRNFVRAQGAAITVQLSAVDEQVRKLIDQGACHHEALGRSAYLHQYLVGALDAITSFFERETRKRLGLELYRDIFARYLQERFLLPRHEADDFFSGLCADSAGGGMEDGYADGLKALRRGSPPRRLLDNFTKRVEIPEPEAAEDIRLAASM